MSDSENLFIIGSPFRHYSREAFLKKLTDVASEVCDEVDVLGANEPAQKPNIVWDEYIVKDDCSPVRRQLSFLNYQLRSALDVGAYDHVMVRDAPCVFSTLLLRAKRRDHSTIITQKTNRPIINTVSEASMRISERLIVEAPSVLEEWSGSYADKSAVGATYVDTSRYEARVSFPDRPDSIGYLGIIRDRKGIPSLLESVPGIRGSNPGLTVEIAGDGPLHDEVTEAATGTESLEYHGYVDDSEVVSFYNGLKLFILPTESEGLPNVALEAMACGTPVLATSVGGIPDLVEDGVNGFLMEGNSPETIERNVSRALESDLESISEAAQRTIRSEYTRSDAIERYTQILRNTEERKHETSSRTT